MDKKKVIIILLLFTALVLWYRHHKEEEYFYQELPNGTIFKLQKNQVFVLKDNTTYTFRKTPECITFLRHLQRHPTNIPKLLIKECVYSNSSDGQ